jgi:dihydropteroate synthase
MIWRIRGHAFDLTSQGLIMGILNVTPDSFSDGGNFLRVEDAVRHGEEMLREGAAIVDVGGESTRPVAAKEEIRRVLPAIETLGRNDKAVLSIDTSKPEVAAAAWDAGAHILNDVSGLTNPRMIEWLAGTDAGAVIMHMKGTPRTMQLAPVYDDVAAEVESFFVERLAALEKAGISTERAVLDPGIGFGKTLEHNLKLLRELPRFARLGRPVLVGVSRKSFLGKILGTENPQDREWPTVALTCHCFEKGARIFRVHDVRSNQQALAMMEAMLYSKPEI